jgi:hypothetical protein
VSPKRSHAEFPVEKLRAAADRDDEARNRIDALHRELQSDRPSSTAIGEHVKELRKHAGLVTLVENWFDDPRTQSFINELILAGL